MAFSSSIKKIIDDSKGLTLLSIKVLEGGYTILYFSKQGMDSTIKLWLSNPWRWESNESVLIAFDDPPESIISHVMSFAGTQVDRISVNEKTGDLTVYFINHTWVNCPVYRREGDVWEMRWPNGVRCGLREGFRVDTWLRDSEPNG